MEQPKKGPRKYLWHLNENNSYGHNVEALYGSLARNREIRTLKWSKRGFNVATGFWDYHIIWYPKFGPWCLPMVDFSFGPNVKKLITLSGIFSEPSLCFPSPSICDSSRPIFRCFSRRWKKNWAEVTWVDDDWKVHDDPSLFLSWK